MANDQRVRERIGPKNVDFILKEVDEGTIDGQMMFDFAYKLGQTIGGNHKRRVKVERLPSDQAEMRRILSDWYTEELYDMNQADAVLALADIFAHDDIKLFPLAHELRNGVKIDEAAKTKHRHRKARQQRGTTPGYKYNNEGKKNMFNKNKLKNSTVQLGDTHNSNQNQQQTNLGHGYNNTDMFKNSKIKNSKIQQGDNHTTNNITTADKNTRGVTATSTKPSTTGTTPAELDTRNIKDLSLHQGDVYKTENKTILAADNINKSNIADNKNNKTRNQREGVDKKEEVSSIRHPNLIVHAVVSLLTFIYTGVSVFVSTLVHLNNLDCFNLISYELCYMSDNHLEYLLTWISMGIVLCYALLLSYRAWLVRGDKLAHIEKNLERILNTNNGEVPMKVIETTSNPDPAASV